MTVTHDVETPHGPARVFVRAADEPRAALVLGHGAGGGVNARDLVAASGAALALGFSVALVEQPYRVAGPALSSSRAAAGCGVDRGGRPPAGRRAARTAARHRRPLVGRARRLPHRRGDAAPSACSAWPSRCSRRAARERRRRRAGSPSSTRVTVPVLIVQGERDPFGMPPAGPLRQVVVVQGDHSLRGNAREVTDAVSAWLPGLAIPAP